MGIIETRDLTRRYGKLTAVDGLTMKVEAGSVFGFIGPNGAGKTTTMRILATLLDLTSGDAWVNGCSVRRDAAGVRHQLGYMPDFFGVYPNMKVWEYLDFFAACYRVPAVRRRRMIDDLLALVDLTQKKDSYVEALSRGMKQRLCLARTLVHDPAVLILDEPASGLDPRARVELRELLKELRSMGKTIFLSSHILSEMAEICTHVGIVERGRLLALGTVEEVMRQLHGHRLVRVGLLGELDVARRILSSLPGVGDVGEDGREGTEGRFPLPPEAGQGEGQGEGDGENGGVGEIASGSGRADGGALSLTFSFDGDEAGLNRVLAKLIEAGVPVYSFAEQPADLEDVFMRLTEGAVA